MGCLGDETISLFLFGDAYEKSCEEKIGTIFALFNCSVRKDKPVCDVTFCDIVVVTYYVSQDFVLFFSYNYFRDRFR